ncbi:ParA family protein [Nonomuraea sp. NPDC001636]|uniref:ParA family protein n=1 Tax=Nonomuraea sp. NPDC001636 TaxID=3154391 RepID=UPI00333110A6
MTGKVLQAVPVLGRENLFVVPGGTALTDLTGVMVGRVQQQGCKAMRALAKVLAPIAGDFDVILIDTPPENTLLCDLALSTGRCLLMPTKTDKGGLVGVQLLAERYAIARELNPALALLGVVLFATNRQATAIHRSVRDRVAVAFGVGSSPVLTAIVGILGSHSRGVRQRVTNAPPTRRDGFRDTRSCEDAIRTKAFTTAPQMAVSGTHRVHASSGTRRPAPV